MVKSGSNVQALLDWARYHEAHSKPLVQALHRETGLPLEMCHRILRMNLGRIEPGAVRKLQERFSKHAIHSNPQSRWGCVAPGNVPDPVISALACSALSQAGFLLKVSKRQKTFTSILVNSIHKFSQSWADRVVTAVSAGVFLKSKDELRSVVIYGNDSTVAYFRSKFPSSVAFDARGHRISISVICASALNPKVIQATVQSCAEDIWLYDQRGCLSPQIVFVQGDEENFGKLLDEALFQLQEKYGMCKRNMEERMHRKKLISNLLIESLGSRKLIFLTREWKKKRPVVYALKSWNFRYPAIGQVVAVSAFKKPSQILDRISFWKKHLQGIAVAGTPQEQKSVFTALRSTSATRMCAVGELQNPPLDWNSA